MSLPTKIGNATVQYIQAREIFTKASGFMDSYDFTLNLFSGCANFACSYCYARYHRKDQAQIENWGNWVHVKINATDLLSQLLPGSLNNRRIYMSSVTDPYQPIERKIKLTRNFLDVLGNNHAPKLVVQTRSPFVSRDIDMFQKICTNNGRVQVNMTITTDNDEIRKLFEPQCPSVEARLREIKKINDAGIQTCITLTPLLLISNVDQFAEKLLATGVTNYIVQPFHMVNVNEKKQTFRSQTDDSAVDVMCQQLNINRDQFQKRYLEVYQYYQNKLQRLLPNLGIGKAGFRPPF